MGRTLGKVEEGACFCGEVEAAEGGLRCVVIEEDAGALGGELLDGEGAEGEDAATFPGVSRRCSVAGLRTGEGGVRCGALRGSGVDGTRLVHCGTF